MASAARYASNTGISERRWLGAPASIDQLEERTTRLCPLPPAWVHCARHRPRRCNFVTPDHIVLHAASPSPDSRPPRNLTLDWQVDHAHLPPLPARREASASIPPYRPVPPMRKPHMALINATHQLAPKFELKLADPWRAQSGATGCAPG